jgi:NhaA family Na+:H+ antiporter
MLKNSMIYRPVAHLRDFLRGETAGGFVLILSGVLAMVAANSALAPLYQETLATKIGGLSVLHWVNDALMVLFFVLVGLEIKRELLEGQLRAWPARALPGVAAIGGMVVPALVYVALNWDQPASLRGWAIPSATDIAFSLGVLSMFGSRVPVSLKVFLTALAIIDDLGAIVIIAIFYSADLSPLMLGLAAGVLALLTGLNLAGVRRLWPYLGLGVLLWFFALQSGVHATVAGVLLALTIPLRRRDAAAKEAAKEAAKDAPSPLHRLEHALHPWSAWLVLPVFGFANAGVSLAGLTWQSLAAPVPLGIAAGLFLGKQVGVFGFAWLAIKLKLARRPARASWLQIYGVALLCGVGFTMSLFIGLLAFARTPELETAMKLGVLSGSLLSILAGALVLGLGSPRRSGVRRQEDRQGESGQVM